MPPENPKGPTEVDVADIMVEATVKKNQLQRIDESLPPTFVFDANSTLATGP